MAGPDPDELHFHKCGWSPTDDPTKHGKGCGVLFRHRAPTGPMEDSEYDRNHCCPECGAGPWKNVWRPGVEESWAATPPDEQAMLQERTRRRKAANEVIATLFKLNL